MTTEIHRSALVLTSAEHLYAIINDIESYPSFLDGVRRARVVSQTPTQMLGELTLAKAGFERTITTQNQLTAPTRIELALHDGPLNSLAGVWSIQPLSDTGCKVSLDLSFDAGGGLKAKAFEMLFKQVADSMVEAFVTRAKALNAARL